MQTQQPSVPLLQVIPWPFSVPSLSSSNGHCLHDSQDLLCHRQSPVFLKSDSTILVCHIMFTLSEPDITFNKETLFSHSSSNVSLSIYVQFVLLLHQVTSSPIMPVFLAQYFTKLGVSNIKHNLFSLSSNFLTFPLLQKLLQVTEYVYADTAWHPMSFDHRVTKEVKLDSTNNILFPHSFIPFH